MGTLRTIIDEHDDDIVHDIDDISNMNTPKNQTQSVQVNNPDDFTIQIPSIIIIGTQKGVSRLPF